MEYEYIIFNVALHVFCNLRDLSATNYTFFSTSVTINYNLLVIMADMAKSDYIIIIINSVVCWFRCGIRRNEKNISLI